MQTSTSLQQRTEMHVLKCTSRIRYLRSGETLLVCSFKQKYLSSLASGKNRVNVISTKYKLDLQNFVMDPQIMEWHSLLMPKTHWKYGISTLAHHQKGCVWKLCFLHQAGLQLMEGFWVGLIAHKLHQCLILFQRCSWKVLRKRWANTMATKTGNRQIVA